MGNIFKGRRPIVGQVRDISKPKTVHHKISIIDHMPNKACHRSNVQVCTVFYIKSVTVYIKARVPIKIARRKCTIRPKSHLPYKFGVCLDPKGSLIGQVAPWLNGGVGRPFHHEVVYDHGCILLIFKGRNGMMEGEGVTSQGLLVFKGFDPQGPQGHIPPIGKVTRSHQGQQGHGAMCQISPLAQKGED